MNSMVFLKEKDDNHVVYRYSSDVTYFRGKGEKVVSDGEIECLLPTEEFITLKKATHDESGFRAEWLYPHLWGLIFMENCPERRFVATG